MILVHSDVEYVAVPPQALSNQAIKTGWRFDTCKGIADKAYFANKFSKAHRQLKIFTRATVVSPNCLIDVFAEHGESARKAGHRSQDIMKCAPDGDRDQVLNCLQRCPETVASVAHGKISTHQRHLRIIERASKLLNSIMRKHGVVIDSEHKLAAGKADSMIDGR